MSSESQTFACPTCGARQGLSNECRRCKCDLSLVVEIHRRRTALRARTLRQLREGNTTQAIASARELLAVSPDAETERLLAVGNLLAGQYRNALQTGLALD